MLLAGGLLASCGNKKPETLKEEATQEVFLPDEKETALDTLQQIDEMVEAVEAPVKGINGTKYDAAFFQNAANKADKASADKYAQTASGLKYVIAEPGKGKSPKATDTVTVHYVGTLTDGTQFDSSIDRGQSIDFPLGAVIPGWTEGLQYMQEGGTAVFYIPSNLAYGPRDLPGIPANSDLIFWVQLLQVN
ncbi:MAG: FKBP-type peptidyl-prolyl cis-trans isomerase [Muribaculaceae bacterium]|nr:FKBP-type peptidyl-prolyl cis-trans isomerase [Muribaculaceae bacterium]